MNYQVVLRELKKIYARIGTDNTSFYGLRHTYAVSSLRAGDDIKTVQSKLDDHTAAFTLDQYGHVTNTMKREVRVRSAWKRYTRSAIKESCVGCGKYYGKPLIECKETALYPL